MSASGGCARTDMVAEFLAVRDGDELRETMWKYVREAGATHMAAASLRRYADGEVRVSALHDAGPADASVALVAERHPNLHSVVLEMLSARRPFDFTNAVVKKYREDFDAIWLEHKIAIGCEYYYCVPVFDRAEPQGYCCYFGDRPFSAETRTRLGRLTSCAYDCAKRLGIVPHHVNPLTSRQCDVLGLCAEGFSDIEIGARLGISAATVKEHMEAAKRRLGVRTRVQAAVRATQSGWLAR